MRANNAPYMNKTLNKVIMARSRLRNKFNINPTNYNEVRFKKQRNFYVIRKLYYTVLQPVELVSSFQVLDNNNYGKHISTWAH